jgi:pimeloyl-ACP methyl ester carboxylesterase
MNTITAGVLDVAYPDQGAPDGWPVVLSHGFPYDAVVPLLTDQGARVQANMFTARHEDRVLAFADAVLTVRGWL